MFDAWKQRQRQRLENRPERTVFYNIFATMMLVLVYYLISISLQKHSIYSFNHKFIKRFLSPICWSIFIILILPR